MLRMTTLEQYPSARSSLHTSASKSPLATSPTPASRPAFPAWLPLAPVFGLGPVSDRLAPRNGTGGFVGKVVKATARCFLTTGSNYLSSRRPWQEQQQLVKALRESRTFNARRRELVREL